MEKNLKEDSFQKEAEELQYSLRATFFYRRRSEFKNLIVEVKKIRISGLDWSSPESLGISESSWKYIKRNKIPFYEVFCHPRVIVSKPHLIAYYRLISVLPQKGVQRLAIGIKSFEEKRIRKIDEKRALMVARVFNASISSMIDSDPDFTISDAHSVGMMNLGTQINGSWRNEIGMEGSRRVKELILKYFLTKGLVSSALSKDGVELKLKRLHTSIGDVQCITLKNKYMIEFGSEPDISLRTPKSVLEAAIEVKAGIDPAGALERYGAAKKSFDRALRENKAATTVYLASCITEGVRRAMSDDRLVKKEFNLTSIFVNDNARREFLEYIQWLAHL